MALIDLVRVIASLMLDKMCVQEIRVRIRLARDAQAGSTQRSEARNPDPAVAGVGHTGWESGHGEIPRLGTACHRVLCDIEVQCNNELIVAAVPPCVVTHLLEEAG